MPCNVNVRVEILFGVICDGIGVYSNLHSMSHTSASLMQIKRETNARCTA